MTHSEILSVFGASIVSLKINTESLNQKRLREIAETEQEAIETCVEQGIKYQNILIIPQIYITDY